MSICGNEAPHAPHQALFPNPGETECEVCPGSAGPIREDCKAGHTYFDRVCVRCGYKWPHSYTELRMR